MKSLILMFCLLFISGCAVQDKRISVVHCEGVLSSGVLQREYVGKRLVRTVLIFTESSDQLSRATDRVPGLPASPGYVQ